MKVLKVAVENESLWKGEFSCTGEGWEQHGKNPCGCLLEVSASDIQYRKHRDLSGDVDIYYGFTCCNCGCFTEIPTSAMPNYVRNMAKEYK